MSSIFEGTGVAIVTPFNEDLSIDFDSFGKVIDHTISGGIDYIITLGTTGETATLNIEEKHHVIDFCKNTIGNRVPLVIGAGGYDTMDIVNALKAINLNGISGILSVAPYYNKPTQRGMFEHFRHIAESTKVPVILYNVPSRTSSNIATETVIKLAKTCSNIVALKEACGDLGQLMQLLKNKPSGFTVLSGDDGLTLPMISLGVRGVISVVANSHPKEFSSLVKLALKGDYESAKTYQYKLIDYINALFTEGSPAGIKAALELMGLCKKFVRLPLVPVSDEHYLKLQSHLKEIS
jgi:4-hydroxy-tetrahydrodipicolinate synthase